MGFKRKPPPGNVRRVVSTGDNIRETITNKAGRLVQIESWLERLLAWLFDRNPDIKDYGSQPEIFEFVDSEGNKHTYIPDFIVWWITGEIEIHEVTLGKRRTRAEIYRREMAAKAICKERGWRYIVWTEQNLPSQRQQRNLLSLYSYRALANADPTIAEFVFEQLSNYEPLTISELVTQIINELNLPQSHSIPTLAHMLWNGEIHTDLVNRLIFIDGAPVMDIPLWLTPREETLNKPLSNEL